MLSTFFCVYKTYFIMNALRTVRGVTQCHYLFLYLLSAPAVFGFKPEVGIAKTKRGVLFFSFLKQPTTLSKETKKIKCGKNGSTFSMVCEFWVWQNLNHFTWVHDWTHNGEPTLLFLYHFYLYQPIIHSKKYKWIHFK